MIDTQIKDSKRRKRILVLVTSMTLFVISLTQYVYTDSSAAPDNQMIGFLALLLGWMNIAGPGISWIANPLLFFSWVLLLSEKYKTSLIYSFLALCFSLSFLFFDTIYLDEGGKKGAIVERGLGYWLWISSSIVTFLGTSTLYKK